jgi:transcriptional regulator with XRE-family HTH domain
MRTMSEEKLLTGPELKAKRLRLERTQELVGEVSGVSVPSVSMLERGLVMAVPMLKVMRGLAEIEAVQDDMGASLSPAQLISEIKQRRRARLFPGRFRSMANTAA